MREWKGKRGKERNTRKKKESIRSYMKPRKKRRMRGGEEKWRERQMRDKFKK